MEESISLLQSIKKQFDCKEVDVNTYSPLTLAYIGDCVYDLIMKTLVVEKGNRGANSLHKATTKFVNAKTQAILIELIQDQLSEEELTIFKRGRNAKSYSSSKNASIIDYRKATGFEALIGYMYLTDNMKRVLDLLKIGMEKLDLTL